jgi:acyl carrier protein
MDMSELEGKVCKILAENLSVPEEQVTPAARFQEDLDADSLDLVEAVLALEEEFGVSIPEEEMEGVQTVGQAIQLVGSKMGVQS